MVIRNIFMAAALSATFILPVQAQENIPVLPNDTGVNNTESSLGNPGLNGRNNTVNKNSTTLIQDISINSNKKGTKISFDTEEFNGETEVKKYEDQTIVRFLNAKIDKRLVKTFNIANQSEFIKTIDIFVEKEDVEVIITPIKNRKFSQLAYQESGKFYVNIVPLSSNSNSAVKDSYGDKLIPNKNERVSFSFQSIEISRLLQMIANIANVNILVSDSVEGTIALELDNVLWSQALDIILNAKGLGMTRKNNVITVAPLSEIATRKREELEAQKATEVLESLESDIIQINYAQASNMASLLRTDDTDFLSPRGKVAVDDRTNSLLISETPSKMQEIKSLIKQLDVPVKQVLIESRIVVANKGFSKNLGVRFGADDQGTLDGGDLQTDTGFDVGLPISETTGVLSTSILGDSFNLNLALSVLQAENEGEIISEPRIITSNGREGSISQGVEIPYLQPAALGAATVEFKEAVLELKVKPQITPNNKILMDLIIRQDSRGDTVGVQGGGQIPSINTRTLQTQVLIGSGQTVVLGGIYTSETQNTENKVPVLGDLALVGRLFRNNTASTTQRELLIFISPSVVRQKNLGNIKGERQIDSLRRIQEETEIEANNGR